MTPAEMIASDSKAVRHSGHRIVRDRMHRQGWDRDRALSAPARPYAAPPPRSVEPVAVLVAAATPAAPRGAVDVETLVGQRVRVLVHDEHYVEAEARALVMSRPRTRSLERHASYVIVTVLVDGESAPRDVCAERVLGPEVA